MPSGPPAILPFKRPLDERWLFRRGVVVGFDGGLLSSDMRVFVVPRYRMYPYSCPSEETIQEVDYFHGLIDGMPVAQMAGDEMDMPAIAFIGSNGFVGKCVTHIQRRWRRWRTGHPKRYEKNMLTFGMLLANAWRRVSTRRDGNDPC